jgi:hypothetical protein
LAESVTDLRMGSKGSVRKGEKPQKGRRLREEEMPTDPGGILRGAGREVKRAGGGCGSRSRRLSAAGSRAVSDAGAGESLRGENARRAAAA